MASPHSSRFLWLALSFGLAACGGSEESGAIDPGDTGGGGSDVSGDGSGTDGGGSDGTVADGGDDGSVPDGAIDDSAIASDAPRDGDARPVCSEAPTKARCQECCGLEHGPGEKTFLAAVLACACTDAICKSVCATTACASPPTAASDPCKACLNESVRSGKADAGVDGGGDGKCVDAVKTACSSDPKCVNYATCLGTCKG